MKKTIYTAPLLCGKYDAPMETIQERLERMDKELTQWHIDNKEWLLRVFRNNPQATANVYRACDELPPPPDVIILDDPDIWLDEGNETATESAINMDDFELDFND